jgi:cytochrome c peroxidase
LPLSSPWAQLQCQPLAQRKETPKAARAPPSLEQEITRVVAAQAAAHQQVQQIELLGKLLLFDKNLSVNRNEACAFCHTPETGFTGPIPLLNATAGAYPGSVRWRYSNRKPMTHTYAPYSPVLHYNVNRGDLVGGNFWDMRATGRRLGNAAAEQAQGPPTNPVEMGLIDTACMVFRASQRPYSPFFESVWGKQAFDIAWPSNIEDICDTPGPPPADKQFAVSLSTRDRGTSSATFDQIAMSIAQFEASHEVSPFTSKFVVMLGCTAKLTAQELQGYDLFRGKANCNTCHRDGGPGEEPFFTDWTASNIGTPANRDLPYYEENKPDRYGCRQSCGSVLCRFRRWRLSRGEEPPEPTVRPRCHWVKHASGIMAAFRFRRSAMSTSAPIRSSSKLTAITAISRA